MTKRILTFYLLFSVSCSGVIAPLAGATEKGRSQHMPTDKILEFSLSRLKESVQRTAQKNDRLVFENETLRKNIRDLQQEREVLRNKKSALLGEPTRSYYPQKEMQLTETTDIEGRKQRTQDLINIFQRDIARIKEEIRALENGLRGTEFSLHKQMLLDKKEASAENFVQAEKKLKSLEQKNRAPAERIQALQEKQNALVQEINALEGGRNRF